MAAKRVASALHVLTSDGHVSCEAWSDNIACEAFIADYFTAGSDDSSEESDNDDAGNLLQCRASTIIDLQTDTVITEFFEIENDDTSNAGEEEMDVDIGKKNIIYVVRIE